ncbi:MAG TPA: hypothetical protein VKU37_02255 [Verrucomicrobiae bacterium]|nr:hypothetical protein [Verrucomicrobiae bacterium]
MSSGVVARTCQTISLIDFYEFAFIKTDVKTTDRKVRSHISMKTTLYLFGLFAVIVSLTGCKPRQTSMTGQVFIVTAGGENVKLGGIRVLLIEKQKATNALQLSFETAIKLVRTASQSEISKYNESLNDIQLSINTLMGTLTEEQTNVYAAQVKFNEAEQKYEQYLATQPLRTNAAYIRIYRDLISLLDSVANQQTALHGLAQAADKTSTPGTPIYVPPHYGRGDVGYWINKNNQDTSSTQPQKDASGQSTGDGNGVHTWRRGGSPPPPTKIEWLCSDFGGVPPD